MVNRENNEIIVLTHRLGIIHLKYPKLSAAKYWMPLQRQCPSTLLTACTTTHVWYSGHCTLTTFF